MGALFSALFYESHVHDAHTLPLPQSLQFFAWYMGITTTHLLTTLRFILPSLRQRWQLHFWMEMGWSKNRNGRYKIMSFFFVAQKRAN